MMLWSLVKEPQEVQHPTSKGGSIKLAGWFHEALKLHSLTSNGGVMKVSCFIP
jgi:hypothetical protein